MTEILGDVEQEQEQEIRNPDGYLMVEFLEDSHSDQENSMELDIKKEVNVGSSNESLRDQESSTEKSKNGEVEDPDAENHVVSVSDQLEVYANSDTVIHQMSLNTADELRFLINLEEKTLLPAYLRQGGLTEPQRMSLCYLMVKNVLKRDISRM
jgi:hypothetical protein